MGADGVERMKASITVALLLAPAFLAVTASAQGMPAPIEPQAISISLDDTTINTGPSGASLESNYFHTPQQPYAAGRLFPCRLQLRVFDKTLLAQSCN